MGNLFCSSRDTTCENVISLYFRCNEGSVTHFYHFFFGVLIPLIEYHVSTNQVKSYKICTDMGPMKRILCELPLNIIEISGPRCDTRFRAHDDKSLYSRIKLKDDEMLLPSYDIFNVFLYDDHAIPRLSDRTRLMVLQYIQDNTPCYIQSIPTKPIILIERTVEPYYSEVKTKLPQVYSTSGSERRVIANHADLVQSLASKYGDAFMNLSLERCSIYYQAHMFRGAKVIIAQHGAALSNIFFLETTANVIEISPPWSKSLYHFRNLSHFCGVDYDVVDQSSDKSVVNIDLILSKVDAITRTWA